MTIDFAEINKYSFLKDNLQSYISNEVILDPVIINKYKKNDKNDKHDKYNKESKNRKEFNSIKKPKPQIENEININKMNDTLFWCFYIIQNNYSQFEFLNNKTIAMENQLKIDIITQIRSKREMMKNYKIAITRIESSIMEKKISVTTLIQLCKIYNFNICYINNRIYNAHIIDENKDVSIVTFKNNEYKYSLISYEDYKKITDLLYEVENLEKPLKSVSSYKLDELKMIYEKLKLNPINSSEKITKTKLYEEIYKYF